MKRVAGVAAVFSFIVAQSCGGDAQNPNRPAPSDGGAAGAAGINGRGAVLLPPSHVQEAPDPSRTADKAPLARQQLALVGSWVTEVPATEVLAGRQRARTSTASCAPGQSRFRTRS